MEAKAAGAAARRRMEAARKRDMFFLNRLAESLWGRCAAPPG
jgi:hypothetical protein